MSNKLISIVIPAYREEKNISLIYNELQSVLSKISHNYNYEIIFVNDGSPDNTWKEIEKLGLSDKNVRWINLSRNFWKEIAISAWIEHAMWDAIITLDWDGQHPVEKIPEFLTNWEKWFQIIYNKRPNTQWASFAKNLSSKLFYKIFNSISEFKLEPGTTDYRLLDRKVADAYITFWEKNRLYRWLTDWLGFKKKSLVFDAKERLDWWESSYSYPKLFELALNSMTSFSLFPLKLVGYFWSLVTLISVILFGIMAFDKVLFNMFQFANISLIIVLNTTLMGILMMSMWLIALYIWKIHEEVLGRPMYVIWDSINIKNK